MGLVEFVSGGNVVRAVWYIDIVFKLVFEVLEVEALRGPHINLEVVGLSIGIDCELG